MCACCAGHAGFVTTTVRRSLAWAGPKAAASKARHGVGVQWSARRRGVAALPRVVVVRKHVVAAEKGQEGGFGDGDEGTALGRSAARDGSCHGE